MWDRLWNGALATLAALMIAAAPTVAQPALQKITNATAGVGMYYMVEYVAEDAGFFKQNGLEIDNADVGSGTRQAAAIMGGSAEVSSIGIEHLLDSAARGGDLVAISSCYDAFPMGITLSNGAIAKNGIVLTMPLEERIRRLKGLRIAITSPGSSTDQLVRTLFLARGMKPDDNVQLQPMAPGPAMLAATEQGSIDGFVWSSPFPELATSKGVGKLVIDPMTGEVPEFKDVPYLTLATSRQTLAAKRPQLLAAVRAYAEAMQFLRTQPEQARSLLRHRFASMDDAQYNQVFDKILRGVPGSPMITEDQVRKAQTTLNLIEKKPMNVSYSAVFYPDLVEQAMKDLPQK
jgi:NitT/TauT family transport system substrate-binding protein